VKPIFLIAALAMFATTETAYATAKIGTGNVAPLEPGLSVPNETPCVVDLVKHASFGATPATFTYTPPTQCNGPWAKIVLSTDLAVTAGIQYDRTATLFLGGVNLFFGTTSEPGKSLAPSWHVERDVTEDTALLKTAQIGQMFIANYQNSTDNSTIYASAKLLFYPATPRYPAPRTPDMVIPLGPDPRGVTTALATGTATLSKSLTLPRNIERARLQVYLQSQNQDEFWYTCTTTALASELQDCGGGTFREGQASIDGTPVGLAPVFPWIYTGGIDPYLWSPTPGIQTLQFKPTTIELTPYVSQLNNGQPHAVALSVNGANNYFSVTGALYLTLDHNSSLVKGAVLDNTLAATVPQSTNTITQNNGTASGTVTITARNAYKIRGYAETSHGKVETAVQVDDTYSNAQNFLVTGATTFNQSIKQTTDFTTTITDRDLSGAHTIRSVDHYPLTLTYNYNTATDGSASQFTSLTQTLIQTADTRWNDIPLEHTETRERISPSDTLSFSSSGSVTSHTGSSTGLYLQQTGKQCFAHHTAARNNLLTLYQNGPCAISR